MALKERGRMKRIAASGGGTLVAPNHESFRVTGIFCVASAGDTYVTLIIDGVTVGKFRVADLAGNHIPYPVALTTALYEHTRGGLAAWLAANGIELTFPLAAGQTLTVSRYAEAGNVCLVYDAFDAGDVGADELNGSKARIRRYLHYVTNTAAITTAGATDLATSLIWPGGDSWPVGGKQVALNTRMRVLGILGCPIAHGNVAGNANTGYSTHLRLLKEGDVLFDDAQEGIPFLADVAHLANAAEYSPIASLIGPCTAEIPYPGLLFPDPLEFAPGEQLTPQLVVAGAAAEGIAASEADVAFILERESGA